MANRKLRNEPGSAPRSEQRGAWLAGAVAIGILVAVGLWLVWPPRLPPPEGEESGQAKRAAVELRQPRAALGASPLMQSAHPTAAATTAHPGATPEILEGEEVVPGPRAAAIAMTKQLIEDYKKRAAYPPESKPVMQEQDPLLSDREVSPISAGGPDGEDPVLTVFPDQISFEAEETPKIYAHLTVAGEKVAAREITGTVFTQEMVPVGELGFHDDGQEGDAIPGDYVYTATWNPPKDERALAASYFVRVIAFSFEGIERRAGTSFQVSRPHARLTGRFRDRLDEGSLLIEAEVEVAQAGRFHLAATIYSMANRPLGLAQTSAELDPGIHWLPLRFYGRIFHGVETGSGPVDGPYILRFASLMTTTSMPNALSRLAEPQFVTQPYRASQFTSTPFNDPFYLEAIERETEELRRLEALTENPE